MSEKSAATQASRGGFIAVPFEIACNPDLGDGAFRTYCVLRRYCFGRRSYCWPSMRTLARDRGCSEETVRRHLRELAAAALVRVEKRGRRNVYHFADQHMFWPTDALKKPPQPQPEEKRAASMVVQEPSRALKDEALPRPKAHRFVGQGFTEGLIHPSPPHGGDPCRERAAHCLPAAALVAHGVSPATAMRLARSYGDTVCNEAIRSMTAYRAGGAVIRNPGGWLYRAITQGFVCPESVAQHEERAVGPPPVLAEADIQADTERQTRAAEAHLAELKQKRRRALAAQGIGEETEVLWQRVTDRLRDQGLWAPVLAATCLRQVDPRTYALQCRAPRLGARLDKLLPAIRDAVHHEAPGNCTVRLMAEGENN
jgi:hypothetical protein